jgi:hypothetical protein
MQGNIWRKKMTFRNFYAVFQSSSHMWADTRRVRISIGQLALTEEI